MKGKRTTLRRVLAGQEGMVLLSTLLILSAVSLVAVGMSGDTTTALQVAGNRRVSQQDFQLADGGADLGVHVILDYLYPDAVDPATDFPTYDDSISLIGGNLTMTHFRTDPNILADIKGYAGNDNENDMDMANLALYPPDIAFDLTAGTGLPYPDATVYVDVDRLKAKYLVGSSIEFAAGYEGIGKGAGAGSVAVYYGLRSRAADTVDAGDPQPRIYGQVGTVYRKVSQVVGGGGE
jgi:hypothetical protein